MINYCVYALLDEKHNYFYIGKGNPIRLKTTINSKNNNQLKRNKINSVKNKTGKNPDIKILLYGDEEYCFNIEKKLISYYGRRDIGSGSLCNCSDGGKGTSGVIYTKERINKLKTFMIQNNPMKNEEFRKKVAESKKGALNPMYGKTLTLKAKTLLSEANSGHNHWGFGKERTKETKEKISLSLKGKPSSLAGKKRNKEYIDKSRESRCKTEYLIISPTGEKFITKFLNSFSKEHNLNSGHMYQVAEGKEDNYKQWKVLKGAPSDELV